MTSTQERVRDEFQRQLDAAPPDTALVLDPPLERPGPVAVRQRIVLDGRGCTIWGWEGPVLRVQAANVTLKNLRIEYTADEVDGGVALQTDAAGLVLENVTVRGAVVGLKAEEGEWRYPAQLHLGTLAPRMAHTLKVRMAVPVPCQLSCNVSGLRLEPASLTPGLHEVRFHLDEMMAETLVYGTLAIQTAFLRREIAVNGRVRAAADGLSPPIAERDRLVWSPADWDRLSVDGLRVSSAPVSVPITLAHATDVPVAQLVTDLRDDVVDLTAELVAVPPPAKKPTSKEPGTKEKDPSTKEPAAKKPPVVPAPPPAVTAPAVPPPPAPPRKTGLTQVKGPLISGVFGSPPVAPAALPPPVAPAAPRLGSAFAPPPVSPQPSLSPPPAPLPPDVLAEAEKKPPSSVRLKPKSTLFGPPPAPPASPPAPEPPSVAEASPPPKPKPKFKPAGTLPGWAVPPPPPPPPASGQ